MNLECKKEIEMSLENSKEVKKGLTGFQIKLIALVFMLLDHIYYFFEFTGKVPLVFSWIGRLAGGLFLFTMVEGYSHTSNKKKYFSRIYFLSVAMGVLRYFFELIPRLQRGDGFFPMNGILSTFAVLIVMFRGIDYLKEKKILRGLLLLIVLFIPPYFMLLMPSTLQPFMLFLIYTVLPSPMWVEGGLFLIISGLIMYIFRGNRKLQYTLYALFILAWMVGIPLMYLRPISLKMMFIHYYEWMGVFAIIFMCLYNGEKGRAMKKLFYAFYPAHIYILYGLSILLYNIMH